MTAVNNVITNVRDQKGPSLIAVAMTVSILQYFYVTCTLLCCSVLVSLQSTERQVLAPYRGACSVEEHAKTYGALLAVPFPFCTVHPHCSPCGVRSGRAGPGRG